MVLRAAITKWQSHVRRIEGREKPGDYAEKTCGVHMAKNWVAAREFKVSCQNLETLLLGKYPCDGN